MTEPNIFTTPFGSVTLKRPETSPRLPLRAWTAADELALTYLKDQRLGNVLLVNDTFGALAVALSQTLAQNPEISDAADANLESLQEPQITFWSDSARSRRALEMNLELNGLATDSVQILGGDEIPDSAFDTIVINTPKSLELLDYQLAQIQQCAMPAATVFGCCLARHMSRSTVRVFRKQLGAAMPSKATKKARLIHVTLPAPGVIIPTTDKWSGDVIDNHWQPNNEADFVTDHNVKVFQGPGTFSQDRLDNATRLFIDLLTDPANVEHNDPRVIKALELREGSTVVDLGCGTGIIATTLARQLDTADFILADASDIAIKCAQKTWVENGHSRQRATFIADDGLRQIPDASVELVVTNPPFHEGHTVDKALTGYLIREAARVLKTGGVILAVAPRQVKIHHFLRRYFSDVKAVTKHPEFVVAAATKARL